MVESFPNRIKQFEQKQMVFSTIGLFIILGISMIANTLHMQSVAEQSTKFISRMVEIGDFREVGLILQEARLDKFEVIWYRSPNTARSFSLPPNAEYFTDGSFWRSLTKEKVTFPTIDKLSSIGPDEIIFEYSRLRLIPYALLVWIVLNLVSIPQTRYMKKRILEQLENDLGAEKGLLKAELARQIRHNLRTPLAALMRIPTRLPDSVKADKELLISTIGQIKSLISSLDEDKKSDSASANNSVEIYDSLVSAVREIALSIPSYLKFESDIDDSIVSAEATHVPFELRALLGNIVNNSIEATTSGGLIKLSAVDNGGEIVISIKDGGRGIASEIINKVFENGFTSGKAGGTGIGLYHAKQWIESWGGKIGVNSQKDFETLVTITLPIKERAKWYVPRLKLNQDSVIVILDDQLAARHLWNEKMREVALSANTKLFSSSRELLSLKNKFSENPERYIFLLDFDLNEEINGLDLLSNLPTESQKFLVTGNFDQFDIRSRCSRDGVFLIPKSQISTLPIIVR
ncbi:MAG: hypothetical protein B7Y39_01930 [Bdellovibrio sp. 28-41-41]|nr:MAG: hypothetical protein B7Y39_01930 [Bdellovibrio sp. 28-41-41]